MMIASRSLAFVDMILNRWLDRLPMFPPAGTGLPLSVYETRGGPFVSFYNKFLRGNPIIDIGNPYSYFRRYF